jgi:hemolysin III
MRKLDHAAIYVLIAATYTPIMLVAVGGTWGISMTGVVWFIALVGIVLSTCCFDRWPWLQLGLKVGLGWIVFTAIVPIVTSLSTPGLLCLLAGGAAYTAGVAFFLWERLRFNHAIWHVFVILGAAFHTAVMFLDVLR